MPSRADRVRGCIIGGAVGDALGAPVEFMTFSQIRRDFGIAGIAGYEEAYGRAGAFTDDTQMTLWTMEGLIRDDNRYRDRGICSMPGVVYNAYLRWLVTQEATGPWIRARMSSCSMAGSSISPLCTIGVPLAIPASRLCVVDGAGQGSLLRMTARAVAASCESRPLGWCAKIRFKMNVTSRA